MSATRPADILKRLEHSDAADGELLRRFAAARDHRAFEELVRRHGPLVLGVCRRVTGHPHDAEDAFQATFLVLATKAGAVRDAALLGNWLYGVAYRVARRARRAAGRRRAREVAMPNPPDAPAPAHAGASDVGPILDEELAALAACYRDAIVLCDLRGASREEAAAALGVPEGTLSSRLANGRKKLAARLMRRGVALSVAGLPAALAEARAATAVPNELVARTCALAADCAAGGAVPGPLAHLLNGGSVVRKAFVTCVATVAAVAGAVYASRPAAEPPQKEPPQPPKVAEKAPDTPKPKPNPKAVAFTTAPKLRHSTDLPVGGVDTVMWNLTGTHLAVFGQQPTGAANGKKNRPVLALCAPGSNFPYITFAPDGDELVGVSADGKAVVTMLREYLLISGRHELHRWEVQTFDRGPKEVQRELRQVGTLPLDSTFSRGYAFAPDLKSYRTVAEEWDPKGELAKLEPIEVSLAPGAKPKSLAALGFRGKYALSADGTRAVACNAGGSQFTVRDLDAGEDAFTHTFAQNKDDQRPDPQAEQTIVVLSPDGRRLVVSRGVSWAAVFDTVNRKELPELEGAKELRAFPDAGCFTADGRLFAAVCAPYKAVSTSVTTHPGAKPREQVRWDAIPGTLLTVWDTQTGKALKTWKASNAVRVAFCPTRPLLAILEASGEDTTRLGFWDFAAEVEKK